MWGGVVWGGVVSVGCWVVGGGVFRFIGITFSLLKILPQIPIDTIRRLQYVLELTAWQCAILGVAMVGWALFDVHGDVPALLETASSYSLTDMGYLVWTGLFTTAAVLWGETKVMQTVSGTQVGYCTVQWLLYCKVVTGLYSGYCAVHVGLRTNSASRIDPFQRLALFNFFNFQRP